MKKMIFFPQSVPVIYFIRKVKAKYLWQVTGESFYFHPRRVTATQI